MAIQAANACMKLHRKARVELVDQFAATIKQLVGSADVGLRLLHSGNVQEYKGLAEMMIGAKTTNRPR